MLADVFYQSLRTLTRTNFIPTVLRNLKKTIFYISTILLILSISCKTDKKKSELEKPKDILVPQIVETKPEVILTEQSKDLKVIITELESDCLDFDNLKADFESDYSDKFIDRNVEKWIFNLEKTNRSQFEQAHLIVPKCKIFENENIISIAFVDLYDYKKAFHLFTFRKSELIPTSSFIFFLNGGDAEDFWRVEPNRIDNLTFQLTNIVARYNDISTKDTTFISSRLKREIKIDSVSGLISIDTLSLEKNLIELKK